MIRKLQRKQSKADGTIEELSAEYRYASHHHLIPLYILSGIALVAVLVLICFVIALWQSSIRESRRPNAYATVQNIENQYLPAVVQPIEKRQYVYGANVRFPVSDPYNTLRYQYDPGVQHTPTSHRLTISTERTLQTLADHLIQFPDNVAALGGHMDQCARLYVVTFQPGDIQYGGFTAFKDVKLKDGRTAYMFKNISCVPESVQAMNILDTVEKDITAIESY